MDGSKDALLSGIEAEEEGCANHVGSKGYLSSRPHLNRDGIKDRIHNIVEAILLVTVLYLAWDCFSLRYMFSEKCLEKMAVACTCPDAILENNFLGHPYFAGHLLTNTAPTLHLASDVKTVYFNGSLGEDGSPWRRPPGPEVDALWAPYIDTSPFSVSFDEVRKMGKNPEDMMRVPPRLRAEYGDGIVAESEFGHQLHCLNMIRKYTYFDHYREDLEHFSSNPVVIRTHIDHCIDMIRQVLMCNPDTGFFTTYWIEGRELAMPDFSTMHKCRNIDTMVQWVREHTIHGDLDGPYPDERIWTRQHHP